MIRKLISEKFGGEAVQKIRKKRKIILKGHYKYMAAFLADQVKMFKINTKKTIHTPFGEVSVTKTSNSDCIIFKDGAPGDYEQLSSHLDTHYLNEGILTTIYNYLSMPYISSVTSIEGFNSKVIDARMTDNYLAVFCGILMVAEPLRFGDGGEHSRACIRRVNKLLIEEKEMTAYSKVFGSTGKSFKDKCEAMAVFAHKGRTDRKRDESTSQRFAVGGKQQELNQLSSETKQYESDDSIQDNAIRMHFFDEDVSDDEEGKKFLLLIENNQLKAAKQYYFLVKQNPTLAKHYYLLISKNQFDIAEIFIELLKSYKDHSYSMNYYYLSLKNNSKILEMYLTLVKKNLKLAYQYFYEIVENCGLNEAEQYFNIIMKTENVKWGNFFYNICKKCVIEKKLSETAKQFYQLISEDKLSEAEKFYRQHFKNY